MGRWPNRALITAHEEKLDGFLARRAEVSCVGAAERQRISAAFVSRLIGADQLRRLLGLEGASDDERRDRAAAAADALLGELDV